MDTTFTVAISIAAIGISAYSVWVAYSAKKINEDARNIRGEAGSEKRKYPYLTRFSRAWLSARFSRLTLDLRSVIEDTNTSDDEMWRAVDDFVGKVKKLKAEVDVINNGGIRGDNQ